MTQTNLPAARAAFTDQTGRPTPQFYRFLETLATAQAANPDSAEIAAINTQLEAIQAEIDALPAGGGYPVLRALAPLVSDGLLQKGFAQLRWGGTTSDVPEGSRLYYTAARFYADMKAQLLAGANITLTPNDGAQTVTVAASGGEQLFNLITDAGDAYLTEDGADLLVVT